MLKSITDRLLVSLAAGGLCLALSFGGQVSTGQEKKPEVKPGAAKEGEKTPVKKPRAEPRGRLPNFYADVVNEEQREAIYGIQRNYADELDDLLEQIKALSSKRDAEIEAVLTPEQKDKVAKAAAEAKAKRVKAAAEKKAKATEEKKADAKTPATKAPATATPDEPKK